MLESGAIAEGSVPYAFKALREGIFLYGEGFAAGKSIIAYGLQVLGQCHACQGRASHKSLGRNILQFWIIDYNARLEFGAGIKSTLP